MIYVIILIAVIIVPLVIFLNQKKKQKKKERYQMEIKMRDEKLNAYINNPREEKKLYGSYQPFEVDYSEGNENKSKKEQHMFQLVEITERAERKYLFCQEDVVCIGGNNQLPMVFRESENMLAYCKIGWKQKSYCIGLTGQEKVMVKRKKAEKVIDSRGIQLQTNDRIFVCNAEYLFQIIK